MTIDTSALASFAHAAFSQRSFPSKLRERSMVRLIDGLACIYEGHRQAPGELALAFLRHRAREGGSTLLTSPLRVFPEYAAWAHGVMAHAIDWDDWTPRTLLHPTAIILPAVLAIGEHTNARVDRVIDAYMVAAEALLRVGRAVNPELFERGWHPSGTIGSIGSAIGSGLLLGHAPTQLAHDVALALCQSGGMFGNRGTMGKPFHVGNTARAGVMAALAVQDGFEASDDILGTRFGFGDTYAAGLPVRAIHWNSQEWESRDAWAIKLFPVGGSRQSLIAALLATIKRSGPLHPEGIRQIDLHVTPRVAHIDHPVPSSWLDSRFSHPYCAAVTILDREATPAQFGEARFAKGDVQALMPHVRVVPDKALDAPHFPTIVDIALKDGRHLHEECTSIVGEDVSLDEIEQKLSGTLRGTKLGAHAVVEALHRDETTSELLKTLAIR